MAQQIVQFGASRAETAAYQLAQKGVTVQRIDGYCNGANTWLQLFDLTAAPAANAVPYKSLQLFGNDGFSYVFSGKDELMFQNGIYVALSTSEVNYVADASGTLVSGDITLNNLDHAAVAETALTTAGDLTTSVDSRTIWAHALGSSKKLVRLDIINGTAAVAYLMLFCKAAPSDGDKPVISIPLLQSSAVQVKHFGAPGSPMLQTVAGVDYRGMYAFFSTTGTTLTQTVGVANKLKASYRLS